jgi:hypothetical protein
LKAGRLTIASTSPVCTCTVLDQSRSQLAVGQVLDAQVQAKRQVAALFHRTNALHVLDLAAAPVLHHALQTGLARQFMVEGHFDAFRADVVDVRESQQVAGHIAGRIVATVLGQEVQAIDIQRAHARRLGRIEAAGDIQEFTLAVVVHAAHQLSAVATQRARQLLQLSFAPLQVARIDPQ